MFKINEDNSMEIIRGDTGSFDFTLTEKDEHGEETPYILVEGDVVTFTVKKSTKDETALIQKIGVASGESTVSYIIEPSDTEGLKYGNYYYDIEFEKYDGYVDTVIRPTRFVIEEEVTF